MIYEKRSKNYKGPHAIVRINAVWLRFKYDKPLLSSLQTLLLFKSSKSLWFAEAKGKQLFYSTSLSKTCLSISTTCIIPLLNCNVVLLSQLHKYFVHQNRPEHVKVKPTAMPML